LSKVVRKCWYRKVKTSPSQNSPSHNVPIFWSKRPHQKVKTSSPRVKTSPSLIIYILILFIVLSFLFQYDLTTSGLLKKVSVIYGHQILREEQQEEEDVV